MPPDALPLRPAEIAVVALDVLIGVVLCGVAAFLVVVGIDANGDPNAPHGGAWEILGAVVLGPPGVLLLVAAVAVARRWRGRWWLQASVVLVPGLFLALGIF